MWSRNPQARFEKIGARAAFYFISAFSEIAFISPPETKNGNSPETTAPPPSLAIGPSLL